MLKTASKVKPLLKECKRFEKGCCENVKRVGKLLHFLAVIEISLKSIPQILVSSLGCALIFPEFSHFVVSLQSVASFL